MLSAENASQPGNASKVENISQLGNASQLGTTSQLGNALQTGNPSQKYVGFHAPFWEEFLHLNMTVLERFMGFS